MKKLFYLFTCLAATVTLSSCLGDGDFGETSPVAGGILLHNATITQTAITLDPFNIAFRLNTLLVEGQGDIKNVPEKTRYKLFPGASTIEATQADGEYQYNIRYNASFVKDDWARSGNVVIKANTLYLSDAGAIWDVTLNNNIPYSFYLTQSANNAVKITPTVYEIYNYGDNEWRVRTSAFIAEISASSTTGASTIKTEWLGNYLIKQESGDQSLEGISKANTVYSVTIENGQGTTVSMPMDNITVMTEQNLPLKYNTSCDWNTISGGALKMYPTKDIGAVATSTWLSESTTDCNPKIRITWDGKSEDL